MRKDHSKYIFKALGAVALSAALTMGAYTAASAQVFLQRGDQQQTSSGGIVLTPRSNDRSDSSNGDRGQTRAVTGSGVILAPQTQDRDSSERRFGGYQVRNKGDETRQGVSYSAAEYNRRLQAQRQAAVQREQRRDSAVYPVGYGQETSDRFIKDETTGRYMKQSEADALQRKRDEYFAKHKNVSRAQRSRSEEAYFNRNGYYPGDRDVIAQNGDAGGYTSFGTTMDYDAPQRRDRRGALNRQYESSVGGNR